MTNQTLRTAGVSAARDFSELPAWQKAITLAEVIFGATNDFPEREQLGLAREMRAKALEVASSIAAASGRNNEFGMTDSYSKAQSANAELMTQITLAMRLGYMSEDGGSDTLLALDEVSRLIVALKHGLKVAAKDAERAERQSRDDDSKARAERPARREYKPREDREDRPRREFKPRDGGDERPRREYKPRDGAERGERKPYGDKKPYGDRKPYGDKKPYGDRKPRGDKSFRKPRD